MPSSLVVPILQTDFTNDVEDMLINYVKANWVAVEPVAAEIGFRPGLFNYHRPYEVCALQTVTVPTKLNTGMGYKFITDVPVALRARRLTTDDNPTKPLQILVQMESELQRIIFKSIMYSIPGIDRLIYDGFDRVYEANDTYAKSEWASLHRVKMLYQKAKI
jgi:hypothetical protein